MKKLLIVFVLVFAVFIISIPQTSAQTIYSCYNKKSGAMRYVTGPGLCKKSETQISFNTAGPTGPQGPTGAAGPTGPTGPPGLANGIQRAVYGTLYRSSLGAIAYQKLSGGGFTITILTDPTDQTEWGVITFDTPMPSMPTCTVTPLGDQKGAETCYWTFTFTSTAYTALTFRCYNASDEQIWPMIFSFLCVQ